VLQLKTTLKLQTLTLTEVAGSYETATAENNDISGLEC
jgi:hypothetical protein